MYQPGLLKDKVFVVTGGGTGLGAAMARRFAELGASVVVVGRRLDKLQETVAACGPLARAFSCDVRDFASVQQVADQLDRVDGLVNNAAGNFLAASEDLSSNGFKT
ncbi:MAG TPA: SDR family NAD(P)-dependent oxidoreductase, partial [Myxococcales bacterium]|nr:SDR family NAD(P)-dependent oxidoreductase [Myxococcales bacterium]